MLLAFTLVKGSSELFKHMEMPAAANICLWIGMPGLYVLNILILVRISRRWRASFYNRLWDNRNDNKELERMIVEFDDYYGSEVKTAKLREDLERKGWLKAPVVGD